MPVYLTWIIMFIGATAFYFPALGAVMLSVVVLAFIAVAFAVLFMSND